MMVDPYSESYASWDNAPRACASPDADQENVDSNFLLATGQLPQDRYPSADNDYGRLQSGSLPGGVNSGDMRSASNILTNGVPSPCAARHREQLPHGSIFPGGAEDNAIQCNPFEPNYGPRTRDTTSSEELPGFPDAPAWHSTGVSHSRHPSTISATHISEAGATFPERAYSYSSYASHNAERSPSNLLAPSYAFAPSTIPPSTGDPDDSGNSQTTSIADEDRSSPDKHEYAEPLEKPKPVDTYPNNQSFRSTQGQQSAIPREILDIMGEDFALFEERERTSRWSEMLLDHANDVIHVVSLKGVILYTSPSCAPVLGYDKSELVGNALQHICHPSDHPAILRELKQANQAVSGSSSSHLVSLVYRARQKAGRFVWFEASGTVYSEDVKGRKCVVLVGRARGLPSLKWENIDRYGGLGDAEFWTEASLDGLFLFATSGVLDTLGFSSEEMVGTSFNQLASPRDLIHIEAAIQSASRGAPIRLRHQLMNRKGRYIDVVTIFHSNVERGAHTVVCQVNDAASDQRRQYSRRLYANGGDSAASVTGAGSEKSADLMAHRMTVLRPESTFDPDGSVGSAQFSAVPSAFHRLHAQWDRRAGNLFMRLDADRTTSWQFELHQLGVLNKRLKDELEALENARRKRKLGGSVFGEEEEDGDGKVVRRCANCGCSSTPEWRSGPSGARELCNACGLRYSKVLKAQGLGIGSIIQAQAEQEMQGSENINEAPV